MSIHASAQVHSSAVVDSGAQIGAGTTVGPFTVITKDVKVGSRNRIGAHVVIDGFTTVGDENQIFQFASVGSAPQDLKFHGEASTLSIGNRNKIREYVTLQPGTEGGGMATNIGDDNLFMACSHVGHDGLVGNGNVFANSSALAGHVSVGDHVIVGGLVGIHQFVRIGSHSMLGAGSMVTKDIPPFCIAQGDRAGLVGINQIGLQRHGYNEQEISELKRVFRALFYASGGRFEQRLQALDFNSDLAVAREFVEFIRASERGVTFPRKTETD